MRIIARVLTKPKGSNYTISDLRPNHLGNVRVIPSKNCDQKFKPSFMKYEKAIQHIKEGSMKPVGYFTVEKIYSRSQLVDYVLKRDKYQCKLCGMDSKTVRKINEDSISSPQNMMSLCEECCSNYIYQNERKEELMYVTL